MEKEIKIATLYTKVLETDSLEILVPTRILFGLTDEDELKFYDTVTQTVYYQIDTYSDDGPYSGFSDVKPIYWLLKEYPHLNFFEAINRYLNKLKQKVYYSLDTGKTEDFCLKSMPVKAFNKKYALRVNYTNIPDELDELDISKVEAEMKKFITSSNDKEEETKIDLEMPSITDVYQEITKHVMCQDAQVRRLLTAIYKNLAFENRQLKSNIFIYGPTGVGKTAMLNQISKILGLPMVIEDSTAFTVAGYVGKSCDEALRHLYEAANSDLELAEHGILVFDEIDKKSNKGSSGGGIASEGVLHSLLKIIEGGVIEVELNHHTGEKIMFDTSNLIVIVSGAFEGLLKDDKKSKTIGFNNVNNVSDVNKVVNNTNDIADKLVEYGMAREFVGRFNTFVKLNELSKDDLRNILLNSNSSALKIYLEQLKQFDVNIKVTDELIEKICDLAIKKHTGARALNNIVNEIFEDILYNLFSNTDVKEDIVLDKDIISEDKKLVLKNTVQNN